MAKVVITGAREYSMKDEETGKMVEGISVHYRKENIAQDGLFSAGWSTDKLSIKKDSELYHVVKKMDFTKPFEAEPVYELLPGSRRPTLTNIIF